MDDSSPEHNAGQDAPPEASSLPAAKESKQAPSREKRQAAADSGGGGSGSKPSKSVPALFAVQDFYKDKGSSVSVDYKEAATSVSRLQQQLELEKKAREELEDLLVRLDGHVQREAAARQEAERRLADVMAQGHHLAHASEQQHLMQERQALDQALKECAAQLAAARSELVRVQQAAAAETANLRHEEAAERQRLVSVYEVMLQKATEQAERTKQDMMMQSVAMQQELARWRKQAQTTADAVLSAKAEVRQRQRELGDVQERMDQLVDQLYAGRDNTVCMKETLALAQRYSALLSGQVTLGQLEGPKAGVTSKLYLQPPFVQAPPAGVPAPASRPLLPSSRSTPAAPPVMPVPPAFSNTMAAVSPGGFGSTLAAPQPILSALVEELPSPADTMRQMGGRPTPNKAAQAAARTAAAAAMAAVSTSKGPPPSSGGWNSSTSPDAKRKGVTIQTSQATAGPRQVTATSGTIRATKGPSSGYATAVAPRTKSSMQRAPSTSNLSSSSKGAGGLRSTTRQQHQHQHQPHQQHHPQPRNQHSPMPPQQQLMQSDSLRRSRSAGSLSALSAAFPESHIPKLPAISPAATHTPGDSLGTSRRSLLNFNTASKLPVLQSSMPGRPSLRIQVPGDAPGFTPGRQMGSRSGTSSLHSSLRQPGSLVFGGGPPGALQASKGTKKTAPKSRLG